ncbi:MAG: hypothetical protein AABY13_01795, partial [Nanoarchaeota archaeon]
ILNHERRCHIEYAERCRKIIDKYKDGPIGVVYREDRHSVESFRFSSAIRPSLTLDSDREIYRLVGYALCALVIAGTLACGVAAYRYLDDISNLRNEQLKNGLHTIDKIVEE